MDVWMDVCKCIEQVCEAFFEGLISVFRIDNAFYDAVFVCLHKVDWLYIAEVN